MGRLAVPWARRFGALRPPLRRDVDEDRGRVEQNKQRCVCTTALRDDKRDAQGRRGAWATCRKRALFCVGRDYWGMFAVLGDAIGEAGATQLATRGWDDH